MNGLIDHTIKKIIAHKKIDVPGLEVAAEVTNFERLRRSGHCAKTAAVIKSNFNLIIDLNTLTLKKIKFLKKKF